MTSKTVRTRLRAARRSTASEIPSAPKKRGPKPKPIVEFPEPDSKVWVEPGTFHEALALHMARHGDTAGHLHKAIIRPEGRTDRKTIAQWAAGIKAPRSVASMEILARIEWRYRLPRAISRPDCRMRAERRPATGSFRLSRRPNADGSPGICRTTSMIVLLKRGPRSWKVEHLGLLFGALAAAPRGSVAGRGVPLAKLGMGMLVFPAVWDWYIQWRERKRGFYTVWEVNMLQLGLALSRAGTGWLRQHPRLGQRLRAIPGLISRAEIDAALADWDGACDTFYQHGLTRSKEIQRVARVHRDPFEPIMPVLEADSPVGEYRRITEEILRLMPDARRYPRAAAEAVRAFLMLRLGLHLGVRQKNLRQLLLCPRDRLPTSERQLELRKCGELRWSERERGWEVLIPASAFKNAGSSFFGNKPFRLVLPDLGGLNRYIDAYVREHRAALLNGAPDPGTFFVKTVKTTSRDAAYSQTSFYEAWRLIIQRYGIYNPYTERGAIKGLLPHGPHNVRDVLATHILKQTGSYEQASYAIQDAPDMVAKHYGRFLPQDKAALAAQILNRVWEAA